MVMTIAARRATPLLALATLSIVASGCGGLSATKTVVRTVTSPPKQTSDRLTERTCGSLQGERLTAKGITCARASALAGALNVEGTEPSGWTCAGTAVVCWRGGGTDVTAPEKFSLMPQPAAAANCPSGGAPVGQAGACAPAPPPPPCAFAGLTVHIKAVSCADARYIMSTYLSGNGGVNNDPNDPGYGSTSDLSPNEVDMGGDHIWDCSGDEASGGGCYDTGGNGDVTFSP
jgi:hypothetical protein